MIYFRNNTHTNNEKNNWVLTLAPIWLPHWPAWMWTISLILFFYKKYLTTISVENTNAAYAAIDLNNMAAGRVRIYRAPPPLV